MSAGRLLIAAILAFLRRGKPRVAPPDAVDPREREVPASARAELLVALLLVLTGACGLGFFVLYLIGVSHSTQWLGLAIGLAFAFLAGAFVVAGKAVVPQEVEVEERPELVREPEEREVVAFVQQSGEGVSRRRLLTRAAGVAGIGLGAALIAPAASLGPNVGERIDATDWRRGVRVVDERGKPILADDVAEETFAIGFPEGREKRTLSAPIVIVRLAPADLHLPAGRDPARWAPEGIVAYSQICTHAGCAISLYRKPTFPPTQPRPALVCPCHYSTFDPARGAKVIFGPAGRPLPQLPLTIDPATRELRAAGGYSGSVGPAWFNVKRNEA
jgi:ubiquinol-cytochrome c reductase iron-sulfur subunit